GFPGDAPQGPPAEIVSFTAEPAELEAGASTTLRWEGLNAFSLTIEPDVGAVATRGSATVTPAATTTYTLTVFGSDGEESESVTVTVEGAAPANAAPGDANAARDAGVAGNTGAAGDTSEARQSDVPRLP